MGELAEGEAEDWRGEREERGAMEDSGEGLGELGVADRVRGDGIEGAGEIALVESTSHGLKIAAEAMLGGE